MFLAAMVTILFLSACSSTPSNSESSLDSGSSSGAGASSNAGKEYPHLNPDLVKKMTPPGAEIMEAKKGYVFAERLEIKSALSLQELIDFYKKPLNEIGAVMRDEETDDKSPEYIKYWGSYDGGKNLYLEIDRPGASYGNIIIEYDD